MLVKRENNSSLKIKSRISPGHRVKKQRQTEAGKKKGDAGGKINSAGKYKNGSWRTGKRKKKTIGRRRESANKGNELRVRCPFLISKWHCYSQGGHPIGHWRGRRHRIDCRSATWQPDVSVSPIFSTLSAPQPSPHLGHLVSHWPIRGRGTQRISLALSRTRKHTSSSELVTKLRRVEIPDSAFEYQIINYKTTFVICRIKLRKFSRFRKATNNKHNCTDKFRAYPNFYDLSRFAKLNSRLCREVNLNNK